VLPIGRIEMDGETRLAADSWRGVLSLKHARYRWILLSVEAQKAAVLHLIAMPGAISIVSSRAFRIVFLGLLAIMHLAV
jgi:hypothetical protein